MDGYSIIPYEEYLADEWDEFVLHSTVNGTFLQTRNFLNYHPGGRFTDASILVYQKNKLIAVLPACQILSETGMELYSHKGATYGGILVRKDYYKAGRLLDIVRLIDEYVSERFWQITLKITADIHSIESSDLLQYTLSYCGYENYVELNTYADLEQMGQDVCSAFDRNKIRNIRKCEEQGLLFRELENDAEIDLFYELLKINLSKYQLKPIHTADEMKLFKHQRIPDNVKFYGVFKNQEMMAGGMMFIFEQANVMHAQNLAADYRFREYSPITYLYYGVIRQAAADGFRALSWGISTEDKGKVLNMGLIRNKESYGSRYQLNRVYYKRYDIASGGKIND